MRSWKIIVGEMGGQIPDNLILSDQVVLEMYVLVLKTSVRSSPDSYCSDVLARMRILLELKKIQQNKLLSKLR
jgi:hypothetical protein